MTEDRPSTETPIDLAEVRHDVVVGHLEQIKRLLVTEQQFNEIREEKQREWRKGGMSLLHTIANMLQERATSALPRWLRWLMVATAVAMITGSAAVILIAIIMMRAYGG